MDYQQYTDPDGEIPRRLLAAASEAFAQHGFALTRVREIVRTADVNLAAVNYYFGGKEGLYAATVKQLSQQRLAENSGQQDARNGDDAAAALYRRVLAILTRFIDGESNSPLGRILAHESMNPTPHFEQLTAEIIRPELEGLGALVQRVAGKAIPEAVQRRAAMSIMGQCLFYLFARRAIDRVYPGSVRSREDCEALARHIADFSLAGIAATTGVSSSGDSRS